MITMDMCEALVREHRMCFEFVLHQDRIAWQLISIYFAIQVGLISGIVIVYASNIASPALVYVVLFALGSLVNLVWFLILHRNKLWRGIWQLKCLQIENDLKQMGVRLSVLQTFYDVLENKYRLVKINGKVKARPLTFLEQFPTLSVITWSMLVIALSWIVAYLLFHSLRVL